MRHSTFKVIRNAYLGHVDAESLSIARQEEKDPFIKKRIELFGASASPFVNWNTLPFTTEFRSVPARERLDDVVYTFLLRFATLIKDEYFRRSFAKPGSASVMMAWTNSFKQCIFAILTLLYGVQWTSERLLLLDGAVFELIHDGRALALRELCTELSVPPFRKELTVAESHPEQLLFLRADQFGSFFWRIIHWMAEAVEVKKDEKNDPDVQLAITIWKHFAVDSMYRILKCGICMMHLRTITRDSRSQLLDDSVDYARLWYNIHNGVTGNTMKNRFDDASKIVFYPEESYIQDVDYMRQVFSP